MNRVFDIVSLSVAYMHWKALFENAVILSVIVSLPNTAHPPEVKSGTEYSKFITKLQTVDIFYLKLRKIESLGLKILHVKTCFVKNRVYIKHEREQMGATTGL